MEKDNIKYDKFCFVSDSIVAPTSIDIVKCRIERPLNKCEAYIETEYGDCECRSLRYIYPTYLDAKNALIDFLIELLDYAEKMEEN